MQVGGGRGEGGAVPVLRQQLHVARQVLAHAAGVLSPALVQPVACASEEGSQRKGLGFERV